MTISQEGNEISLYGTIWQGDGPYIAKELRSRLGNIAGGKKVRLHSPGGSVIDGNLIYNALNPFKKELEIIVDGLAASMASIIIMSAGKVSMAENAFLMIHAPSGSINGNAKDMQNCASILSEMEKNFITKYASKTKKERKDVEKWMQGDNWFSATQALAEGLIDEIVDEVIDVSALNASGAFSIEAVSDLFKDDFPVAVNPEKQQPTTPKMQNSTQFNMSKIQLSAVSITALNLSDQPTDEQINAAIAQLVNDKKTAETNAANEKKRADELQAKMDQEQDAAIDAMIDAAVKEGKFGADKKDHYKKLAKADISSVKEIIAALPSGKRLPHANQSNNDSASVAGREKWTAMDWMQKDMKGLHALKEENPDAYQALFNK
ncbi:MAG: Clp protease ClpP [Crocinitomicaceae bacterium]|jgi:ATP-dependent Clp endopeptidase proteolytic subunit ClpP|nr:Clp protease ClpP [Crocinitomicaceae bacterium]